MRNLKIKEELLASLEDLPEERQLQVLSFARSLNAVPRGVPGKDLLRFAGALDDQSAREITDAIEEGCERVDLGEW
jgi:hypothetical protein